MLMQGNPHAVQVNCDVIFLDSSPSNGLVSEDPYVKRHAHFPTRPTGAYRWQQEPKMGSCVLRRWGNPGDASYGDVHFYDYSSDCFDPATYPAANFISEFGFQSWPSWPVYQSVTAPEDWDRNSSMSQFRCDSPLLNARCTNGGHATATGHIKDVAHGCSCTSACVAQARAPHAGPHGDFISIESDCLLTEALCATGLQDAAPQRPG